MNASVRWSFACTFVLLVSCILAQGTDWPTHRHDAARSACVDAALPTVLKPSWKRAFPRHQVAFPNEPRQQFDMSYEPVCMDGILVVGSPVDGGIRAYSAETGALLWERFAEAPVRLAPVLWNGLVLVGADDGVFRCLALTDGRTVWERRVYPEERGDLRLLGNNRLVSMWPVRGGPVVRDGVVYFGAGIWPTMGIYAYALDAKTGKVVWTNAGLSHLTNVRIDHNALYDAGVSPQGYLLATPERIVIPNGRSHPVALNRADGKLFHFVQGYRNGHCRVVIGGEYAFVGQRGIVSLVDFREVGNKWSAAGKDAPNGFDGRKADQFEGPYYPYKKFVGCDADSVFDGSVAYSFVRGVLYAHDVSRAAVSETEATRGGHKLRPLRWDAPMTRRQMMPQTGDTRLFAKAGRCLYGRAGTNVVAIELPEGKGTAKVVWTHDAGSKPTSMAVASDRLFVACEDGSFVCFAEDGAGAAEALTDPEGEIVAGDLGTLRTMLGSTAVREGICVVLGGMDAHEADTLLGETALRVLAIGNDAGQTNALRRRFTARGVYGTRFEALTLASPLDLRLAPCLASILWIRSDVVGTPSGTQLKALWKMVHPYGGTLVVSGPGAASALSLASLPGAEISGPGVAVRPEGLEGAADWTHETADAARTHFSRDAAVRYPIAPIWYGDGPGYGFTKRKDYGRGVKPQVVRGRVFALRQSDARLFAYDAYTGRVLWAQRGEGKEGGFVTRYASCVDGVYVAGRGVCVVYDPATGTELRRMNFAKEVGGKARAACVIVTDDSVLIGGAQEHTVAIEGGLWDVDVLVCFDRRTGALRWVRKAKERFNIKALCASDNRFFCTDSPSPLTTERWRRLGKGPKECASTVLALDAKDGTLVWQRTYRAGYHQRGASGWLGVRSQDDWLVFCEESGQLLVGREKKTMLLNAADGQVVWDQELSLRQPVVLMGDQFLDQSARIFQLETGKVLRSGLFKHGGCNYAVATPNLVLLRDRTVCYIDMETGDQHRLRNMRSGCSASIIAASGLLNIPNFAVGCVCNYPVQTSSAWMHAPGVETWGGVEPVKLTSLALAPKIPLVSAEEVSRMHQFKRSYYVDDPVKAAEHLIGRWTFDTPVEGKADLSADVSGKGVHCKLTNPAFEKRGEGRALVCKGEAAGTNGTANLKTADLPTDALTMAAWVRLGPEQYKSAGGIVERAQFYRLMIDTTKPPYSISLSVQVQGGSWRSAKTGAVIKSGEWIHVAGTYDGEAGEVAMYLNGKRVSKADATPSSIRRVSGSISIAMRDGGAFLTGALDDVRVYNRALGPKAIAAMLEEK